MVNEAFLRQYDVGLGDRLRLQAFAAGETEQTPVDQRRSPAVEARIVGVVRTLQDLSAANDGGQAKVSATIFTRPGVDRRMEHAAAFFSAVLVQARDGDATRARAAIDQAFPDRPVNNQYGTSADDEVPLRDAYHYEAQAALGDRRPHRGWPRSSSSARRSPARSAGSGPTPTCSGRSVCRLGRRRWPRPGAG